MSQAFNAEEVKESAWAAMIGERKPIPEGFSTVLQIANETGVGVELVKRRLNKAKQAGTVDVVKAFDGQHHVTCYRLKASSVAP